MRFYKEVTLSGNGANGESLAKSAYRSVRTPLAVKTPLFADHVAGGAFVCFASTD
jgi:hypothetical protein